MAGESKRKLTPNKRHQQQMLVQVWLPMGFVLAAFIAVAVMVILAAGASLPAVGQAANVSMIFLIAPVIVMGMLYAFLVGLAIYLAAKLNRKVPSLTRPMLGLMEVIRFKTNQFTDGAANPFIKSRSYWAAVRRIFIKH